MDSGPGAPPAKPASGSRSWSPLLTAAVVAAVVLAGYELCGLRPSTSLGEQQAQMGLAAGRIREAARKACERKIYRDCLSMYDEAKRFDPQGDLDPEVQAARRDALNALEAEGGAP